MKYFSQELTGIDGAPARLDAYIIDDFEEIDSQRTRPAVLVLPGGGYLYTSDREAEPIAMKLLGAGYQAFVLRYSVFPSEYPVALLEAAEAMTAIRANAREWNVDARAVAVLGFSAGGHLAGMLATAWDSDVVIEHGYSPELVRPDGLAVGYPVVTSGPKTHQSSMEHLLGQRAHDPVMLTEVSVDKRVNGRTPPSFLWHTATDDVVPVENSLMFTQACVDHNVPVELHIYPSGGHGLSLGTRETISGGQYGVEECVQSWFGLFVAWMGRNFGEGYGLGAV